MDLDEFPLISRSAFDELEGVCGACEDFLRPPSRYSRRQGYGAQVAAGIYPTASSRGHSDAISVPDRIPSFESGRLFRHVDGSHRIELSRPMRVFKSIGLAAIIVLTGTAAGIRAQQPARTVGPARFLASSSSSSDANSSAAARGQARRAIAATAIAALTRHAAAAGEGHDRARYACRLGHRCQALHRPAARRCRGGVRRAELDLHAPDATTRISRSNGRSRTPARRSAACAEPSTRTSTRPNAWAAAPVASAPSRSTSACWTRASTSTIPTSAPDPAAPSGPIRSIPADGIDNDGNGYVDDVHGWDFAGNDNSVYDGSAADAGIDSHGTHVAGTIAARRGNSHRHSRRRCGRQRSFRPSSWAWRRTGTTANAVLALDYLTDLKKRHQPEHRRDQQLVGRRRLLPGPARRHRPRRARGDPVHRRGRQRRP